MKKDANKIRKVRDKLRTNNLDSKKEIFAYYYNKYYDFVRLYSEVENIEEIYSNIVANCIDEYANVESTEYIGKIIKRKFMNQVRLYNNDTFKFGKKYIMEELTRSAFNSKEARDILIERYMYLIDRYLKNIKFNDIFTYEDARQIGYLNLIDKINQYFEKERNYSLSLYLNDFFKNDYISKIIEAYQFQTREIPSGLLKLQEDLTDEFFEFEWNDFVDNSMNVSLNTKEKLKYLLQNNKCEIAKYFNVSGQSISQVCEKNRIKVKMFKS